jgi:hypothetical protein
MPLSTFLGQYERLMGLNFKEQRFEYNLRLNENVMTFLNIYIHTYHSRFIPVGVAEAHHTRQCKNVDLNKNKIIEMSDCFGLDE